MPSPSPSQPMSNHDHRATGGAAGGATGGTAARPVAGGLQTEVGKRHPFEHPEQEAILSILRTASRFTADVTRLTRSKGLSQSGYNVLRILRGSHPRSRACHEIGRELVVAVPDVTRLVDRLQEDGLVRRSRCPVDRRVVRVEITEAGLARLEELDAPMIELHKRQIGHLHEDELRTISRLLYQARHPEG